MANDSWFWHGWYKDDHNDRLVENGRGTPNTRRSWWVSGGTHSSGLITDPTMLEGDRAAFSAYVGGQKIYYPDEQKPKSKVYYTVRVAELVVVALIFMASKDVSYTGKGKLQTLFTKFESFTNNPTLTYMLLLVLLGLCGVYMFAMQGYNSFAVDSALLGLVMVGYHGHIQGKLTNA